MEPTPNKKDTRLKSNKPISPQLIAPMIVMIKARQFHTFISLPPVHSMSHNDLLIHFSHFVYVFIKSIETENNMRYNTFGSG